MQGAWSMNVCFSIPTTKQPPSARKSDGQCRRNGVRALGAGERAERSMQGLRSLYSAAWTPDRNKMVGPEQPQ
jgi:hypothetical protein